mgnify:CR=1 FL=1
MRAVITFHSIDDGPGPLSFSPKQLEGMLDALAAAKIAIVPLDRLLADPRQQAVSLTFDDGLLSVFESAMPILRARRVPAHVFVIARQVGGDNSWPGQPAYAAPYKLMDWRQLAAIQEAGFLIESHTATHPDLRELSEAEIAAEMEEADETIEARLGRRPRFFAYPYGFQNERARTAAVNRYQASFTTKLGFLRVRDPLSALPRLDSHYLRSPRLVSSLPGASARTYIALRRALRRLRRH